VVDALGVDEEEVKPMRIVDDRAPNRSICLDIVFSWKRSSA